MSALADVLVRRLPAGVGFEAAGTFLAERLQRCAADLPDGVHLILGGSLARGEPSIIVRDGGPQLISDIDLLMVHETLLPPFPTELFVARHAAMLPTITLMSLSSSEYARLGTSLGYDFKDGGVPVGRRSTPPFHPVTVTARDALEVFAFTVFMYFFDRLGDRWVDGDDSVAFHHEHSRVCSKILRSVGMLHGMHSQHETAALPGPHSAWAAGELAWLRSPGKVVPPAPGRVWQMFADALAEHDRVAGRPVRDAVTGSVYEGRPGAAFIADHQAIAIDLLRAILSQYDPGTHDAGTFAKAKDAAWRSLVAQGRVRPFVSPESFLAVRAASIRDQLLLMKV